MTSQNARLTNWADKKREEWTADRPGLLDALKADSPAEANNARYEALRRGGMSPDEALSALASEQGKTRSQINCPLYTEDEGDIDEAIRML